MTANAYEQGKYYHVMLSWYQDGIRKQKSITTGVPIQGNNKRKVEAVRKEILKEWEQKITNNFLDILFSEYLKEWLESTKHSIEETTYSSYKATIENQICPYFEERKIKLHELKPHHIQSFYTWKMTSSTVTGNTIRRYHANIHKALRIAYETERIKDNPASKVALPKAERYIADFYTADELHTLLNAVSGSKIEVPVYLASWFGLRRGEVLGLRWQDVAYDDMTLSVRGVVTDKGSGSRTENLKYRNRAKTITSLRTFPLPFEVSEYLKRLQARQAENRELLGNSYIAEWSDFICVDTMGELIKPEYLSRAFRLFLKKHGLRHIRLHELRHSNASLLLDNGVDMKMLQDWLGHSHYSTTAGYAHHRTEKKRELGDVLSKALTPQRQTC